MVQCVLNVVFRNMRTDRDTTEAVIAGVEINLRRDRMVNYNLGELSALAS